tara:strand:- start:181 stop:414 length:234 start_codon:yes stop_codon:yes gene_type:complete
LLIKIKVDRNMIVTYDVFSEKTGTVSRHKSLEEAIKAAKKIGNIPFAIFKSHCVVHSVDSEITQMPELVKWVFPKKR